jgi:hypothetical protein
MSKVLLYSVAPYLALTEFRKRAFGATDTLGEMTDLYLHDPGGSPEAHLEPQQIFAALVLTIDRMAPKSCIQWFHCALPSRS